MMIERKCANKGCGKLFKARAADVARGWGKFCSKSCKAVEQEGRTHQNAKYIRRTTGGVSRETYTYYQSQYGGVPQFDRKGNYAGFCDRFSNEEHDCNKEP